MQARRASFVLGMLFCGSSAAAQETQVALHIAPSAARMTTAQKSSRRFVLADGKARDFAAVPEAERSFRPEARESMPTPMPRVRFDVPRALEPLRVTAERSSFLTEARIPIVQLWSGRLRFSGVQQRFHEANLYSTVNPAHWAEIALAPGVESIVGRARVNYGVGLQLRFGR